MSKYEPVEPTDPDDELPGADDADAHLIERLIGAAVDDPVVQRLESIVDIVKDAIEILHRQRAIVRRAIEQERDDDDA